MNKWKLNEAKNKFNNLIDTAVNGEAQYITNHGEKIAVVVSIEEYKCLKKSCISLKEFISNGPSLEGLDIERSIGISRKTDL